MFLTVVSKEIIGNLLSFRFTITTILCLLLMSISAYTLRERYERQLSEYNTAYGASVLQRFILLCGANCVYPCTTLNSEVSVSGYT